jgi:hypothetical protein
MQTDAHIRKAGGRLSREDQRRLGDILQRVYDDVVRQGVPDRFRELLNELDDSHEAEGSAVRRSVEEDPDARSGNGKSSGNGERERHLGANALEHPHNKGSS